MQLLNWTDVSGWACEGGSLLGIKRTLPDKLLPAIGEQIQKHSIGGLIIIGGFEAFVSLLHLAEARRQYREFCIPMVVIPATISNNVPGTEFSLGADTALNEICVVCALFFSFTLWCLPIAIWFDSQMCDKLKQSATGTRRRMFVVETMGGACGYLATLAALSTGADAAYISEEPMNVCDLQSDVRHLAAKMTIGVQRGMVIRAERAHPHYSTDFITRLFTEEGKDVFNCREAVLGHVQQGGSPTPFDRNLGTKMAARAVNWVAKVANESRQADGSILTDKPESAALLGLLKRQVMFTPIQDLKTATDFE